MQPTVPPGAAEISGGRGWLGAVPCFPEDAEGHSRVEERGVKCSWQSQHCPKPRAGKHRGSLSGPSPLESWLYLPRLPACLIHASHAVTHFLSNYLLTTDISFKSPDSVPPGAVTIVLPLTSPFSKSLKTLSAGIGLGSPVSFLMDSGVWNSDHPVGQLGQSSLYYNGPEGESALPKGRGFPWSPGVQVPCPCLSSALGCLGKW